MADDKDSLNSLILRVAGDHAVEDPLDRLELACSTARELDEVADQLVTYFVNEARDAGLSWTQIGERMGVTKQAARKRFVPRDIPDEPSVLRERIHPTELPGNLVNFPVSPPRIERPVHD